VGPALLLIEPMKTRSTSTKGILIGVGLLKASLFPHPSRNLLLVLFEIAEGVLPIILHANTSLVAVILQGLVSNADGKYPERNGGGVASGRQRAKYRVEGCFPRHRKWTRIAQAGCWVLDSSENVEGVYI